MPRILAIAVVCWLSGFSGPDALARTANISIERIQTGVLTMDGIRMRVVWPEGSSTGQLQMQVDRLQVPSVAGDYAKVTWSCGLQRVAWTTWRCSGPIAMPGTKPARFSLDFRPDGLDLGLQEGAHGIQLTRRQNAPDLTLIDLKSLPVAWARAFVARSWPAGDLQKGTLAGRLAIQSTGQGIVIRGPLQLQNAALKTRDDSLIAENLSLSTDLDYRTQGGVNHVQLKGTLLADALAGTTFVSLQGTPAAFDLSARSVRDGWHFDPFDVLDANTLHAQGSFDYLQNGLRNMDIRFTSQDARGLRDRYLSGWLAPLGLSKVELTGELAGRVYGHGDAPGITLQPQKFSLHDPDNRFQIRDLDGSLALSPGAPMGSALRWSSAHLYGLEFGATELPFKSANGELLLADTRKIPVFGGHLRLDNLMLRMPHADKGLTLRFGLGVENVDFGALSKAVGLPAFRGTLNGALPDAVYENDTLTLGGGLDLDVFEGRVAFSSLSVERPFGTAPTVNTNLDLDKLDLYRLTEVLGFGSITGRLSGHIHRLRLVDWTPVRFDAELHTVKVPGVKQRISQTAVKNISSVGGSSPTAGLQAKALELFKDFGYSRLGISCRLNNSICMMGGLDSTTSGSGSNSFTILQGAGIPRLSVVGHNQRVDWPVLVERLKAVAEGDVKPVFEH